MANLCRYAASHTFGGYTLMPLTGFKKWVFPTLVAEHSLQDMPALLCAGAHSNSNCHAHMVPVLLGGGGGMHRQ